MKKNQLLLFILLSASGNIFSQCNLSFSYTKTDYECSGGVTIGNTSSPIFGTITVNTISGNPPYQFKLNNGNFQSSNFFDFLTEGNYTLYVQDSLTCIDSVVIAIDAPPQPIINFISINEPTCFPGCDGSISIQASGGTIPFQYSYNSNALQSSNILSNLCSNTYTIILSDANGCTASSSTYLSNTAVVPITITNVIQPTCIPGCDGSCSVNAIPGGVYTIMPSGSLGANGLATGLCAGITYTITVTDANGCTASTTVVLTMQGGTPISIVSSSNATCSNACDGSAQVTNNGSIAFNIAGAGSPSISSNGFATNLCSNTNYYITSYDSNLCNSYGTISIGESPAPISINIVSILLPSCSGLCDGRALFSLSGNANNINYSFNPSGPFVSNDTIYGLCKNTSYTFTANYTNNCFIQTIFSMPNLPSPLSIMTNVQDATCNRLCDGLVNIISSGGINPHTYSITQNQIVQTTNQFQQLCAGTYTCIVQDANTCTSSSIFTVTQPDSIELYVNIKNPSCRNGEIYIYSFGGTGQRTYFCYPNAFIDTTNYHNFFIPDGGTFYCVVVDENNCTDTLIKNVVKSYYKIDSVESYPESCQPGNDGQIAIITSHEGSYLPSYSINNNSWQQGAIFPFLKKDAYIAYVQYDSVCYDSMSVHVNYKNNLLINHFTTSQISCHGLADGSIRIEHDSNVYTFKYPDLTVDSINHVFEKLSPNNYTIAAINPQGCKGDTIVIISEPDSLQANIYNLFPTYGDCHGKLNIAGIGGTAPYIYQITPHNISVQTDSNEFDFLCNTTYTVSTLDAHGCSTSTAVFIPFREVKSYEYKLYPNPANNLLTLVFNRLMDVRISCFTLYGACVLQKNYLQQDKIMIPTHMFANGIYFIEMRFDDQLIIRQIEILH